MCLFLGILRSSIQARKPYFRVDHFEGGGSAAAFNTLIRTAKLNGLEPEAYLRDVLTRIGAHPVNRLHELLPWNIGAPTTRSVAA